MNIHGWFDFDNFYHDMVHKFAIENRKYNFVEIGCWKGMSSAFMAVEIANSFKNIDFYCVDTWKGSKEHIDINSPHFEAQCLEENGIYDIFIENMQSVIDYIKPIRLKSIDAAQQFEDGFFDFVFIDGSHEYEDIRDDINAWYPKVKSGGLLAGHDYIWLSVKRAIDEFADNNNLTYEQIKQKTSCWLIRK
jgi:predicted O-methyltransferase YrrM